MKLNSKSVGTFLLFVLLGMCVGGLAWEVLERILTYAQIQIALSSGPLGIDLSVLTVQMRFNPGSLLGMGAGVLLFIKL